MKAVPSPNFYFIKLQRTGFQFDYYPSVANANPINPRYKRGLVEV